MILSCPSCETRYLLDPVALGPTGRTVRCARCRHEWYQRRPPPEADAPVEAAETAAPTPDADPELPRPAAEGLRANGANLPALAGRRRAPRGLGWAALALVVAVAIGGAFLARDRVVAAWPPAAGLYAAIGLEVAAPGLSFRNVQYARSEEDGQGLLTITGEVVNTSHAEHPVPQVVVIVLDSGARPLVERTASPAAGSLAPGGVTTFDVKLSNPPAEAARVAVKLAGEP